MAFRLFLLYDGIFTIFLFGLDGYSCYWGYLYYYCYVSLVCWGCQITLYSLIHLRSKKYFLFLSRHWKQRVTLFISCIDVAILIILLFLLSLIVALKTIVLGILMFLSLIHCLMIPSLLTDPSLEVPRESRMLSQKLIWST